MLWLCSCSLKYFYLWVLYIVACANYHSVSAHYEAVAPSMLGFKVFKGEIDKNYNEPIKKDEHHVYQYEFKKSIIKDPNNLIECCVQIFETLKNVNLKVYAEVDAIYDNVTHTCPLHFTIRQRQDVKAWELPAFNSDKHGHPQNLTIYRKIERTLCFNAGDIVNEDDIIVMISTCSEDPFNYSFKVAVSYDLYIPPEEQVTMTVALFSPLIYRFKYAGAAMDSPVIVTANSDDEICMIISIQSPQCPVLETESTVRYTGHWQTISTQAGITVPREYFPDGFFIVLVILSDDTACEEYKGIVPPTVRKKYWKQISARANSEPHLRNKTLHLYIREVMDEADYVLPVLLPLTFYVALILIVFLNFVGFHRLKIRIPQTNKSKKEELEDEKENVGCKAKLRATVFISDFVKADYKSLQKKSKQYFWSVTTVAVFYCAPVVQLIFNYVKVLYRTGEHDLCYYNFLCAHPYKNIMDFNHLYSNIGYIILGITFMVFVRLRHGSLKQSGEMKKKQLDRELSDRYKIKPAVSCWRKIFPYHEEKMDHGVLEHFGLFYAMGVALVMEGALSTSYHLCPNQTNFQYDTSFMYVIAVLAIVKVYQFRHPVNVNANILLLILALVSIYTMFGLLFENLIFKMIFTVFYALFLINILTYLYYVGYLKNQNDEVVTNWLDVYKFVLARWIDDLRNRHGCFAGSRKSWSLETDSNIIQLKLGPNRLLLPILSILFNTIVLTMIWTVMSESNFATQVLAILIVNLVTYTFYYAVMKNIHDEYEGKVWLQTLVYGIIAVVLWIFSLNYFSQANTSWEKSPAESRVQNTACFFMGFYDEHDMWHFLSAGAMFCSFMVLLTLDDDLIYTPQSKIPVF